MMRWFLVLLLCLPAAADVTDWESASAVANQARGGSNWTSTSNATGAPNAVYSSVVCASGSSSNWIVGTGYSFTIPADSEITGVEVRFAGDEDDSAGGFGEMRSMSLVVSGTTSGTAKSNLWSQWPTTDTRGGSSDLWGLSLTRADVVASGFGAAVWGAETDDFGNSTTLKTDAIEIRIHYTPPPEDDSSGWWLFFCLVPTLTRRFTGW